MLVAQPCAGPRGSDRGEGRAAGAYGFDVAGVKLRRSWKDFFRSALPWLPAGMTDAE